MAIHISATPSLPAASVLPDWHGRNLLLAPHRLGFFLGVLVLILASGWWEWVQLSRVALLGNLPYAISPTLVHASVMVMGFFPLFYSVLVWLALVTRMSCGHSGCALVADNLVWVLFWALQCATLMRIVASSAGPLSP
nr:NnrS family protein [Rhodoferax sp.]